MQDNNGPNWGCIITFIIFVLVIGGIGKNFNAVKRETNDLITERFYKKVDKDKYSLAQLESKMRKMKHRPKHCYCEICFQGMLDRFGWHKGAIHRKQYILDRLKGIYY